MKTKCHRGQKKRTMKKPHQLESWRRTSFHGISSIHHSFLASPPWPQRQASRDGIVTAKESFFALATPSWQSATCLFLHSSFTLFPAMCPLAWSADHLTPSSFCFTLGIRTFGSFSLSVFAWIYLWNIWLIFLLFSSRLLLLWLELLLSMVTWQQKSVLPEGSTM